MSERKRNQEFLAASVSPETLDHEARTVDAVFFTGVDVERYDYFKGEPYILRFKLDGADLSLLNARAPVFDNHESFRGAAAQMGVIEKAWRDGNEFIATLRFSKRPDVDGLWQDIADRIVTKFSMGVSFLEKKETPAQKGKLRVTEVTKWQPFEISVAPLPADNNTRTLSAEDHSDAVRATAQEKEGTTIMPETTHTGSETAQITLSGQDVLTMFEIAKACHLDAAFAEKYISQNTSVEDFRKLAIDEQARRASLQPQIRHQHAEITRDHREGLLSRMEESVVCRYTSKQPSDGAREFMNARLADLAREICVVNGLRPSYGDVVQLAMHSTSDFANLLEGVGRRMLLDAYTQAASPIKSVVRRSLATDFRTRYALRISGAPSLEKVPEGGEVTSGTRFEAKESYSIATFARIFSITRQAIVNDDLAAFADFARAYGRSAAAREADNVVSVLYGSSGGGITMGDAQPLFHSTHGNLASSGAAISDETLSAARLALRTAKDIDGATLIEAAPRYLLVPAALESIAEKYLAGLCPTRTDDVNPFSNKLELLVEPRLDAKSAFGWYVFASPDQAPVLEEAFLSGAEGVQVESRPGWEVLGVEFRAILDHGVGAIGTRGVWKNPGQ